jgi:hypothetical protein
MTCEGCGCTDERGCVDASGGRCRWVLPRLCSACLDTRVDGGADLDEAPIDLFAGEGGEAGVDGFAFDEGRGLWLPD